MCSLSGGVALMELSLADLDVWAEQEICDACWTDLDDDKHCGCELCLCPTCSDDRDHYGSDLERLFAIVTDTRNALNVARELTSCELLRAAATKHASALVDVLERWVAVLEDEVA